MQDKLRYLKILESYEKQIKDLAPYINIAKLADEIKVSRTTLWRVLNGQVPPKMSICVELEKLGLLKTPIIIDNTRS